MPPRTTIIAQVAQHTERLGASPIPHSYPNPVWKFLLPILGLWVLLYGSFSLSRPPLFDGPDTLHAVAARDMVNQHTWTSPHATGLASIPDQSIAASYRLFGVSDWAARLPLALTVLALVLTAYFLARRTYRTNAAGLYASLIVLLWPGTFLSTRLLSSLSTLGLPVITLLSLPVAGWLSREELRPQTSVNRGVAWILLSLATISSIALGFAVPQADRAATGGTFTSFAVPAAVAVAALLAGSIGNLIYRLKSSVRVANCFLAGMMAGILIAIQVVLVIISPLRSSEILANAIRPEVNPEDRVFVYGMESQSSSFLFYLDHAVQSASDIRNLNSAWASESRVFLWKRTSDTVPPPNHAYVIAQRGGKEILSNRPNTAGADF